MAILVTCIFAMICFPNWCVECMASAVILFIIFKIIDNGMKYQFWGKKEKQAQAATLQQ